MSVKASTAQGTPPDVNADDPRCARREACLDLFGIEVVRFRVYVAENRRDAVPLQRVGSGDKRVGGDHDFPGQSRRPYGDLQADSGVADGDAVLHAEHGGQALLELLRERAVIGEPAAIQHVVDARHQPVSIADIGPPDVERFWKQGGAAENSQAVHCG